MPSHEEPTEQASDPTPDKQPSAGDPKNVQKRRGPLDFFTGFFKERRSNFRALVYAAIGAFFVTYGGFYYNNRHAPPWIAVLLVFVGGVFESFAARQVVINFRKSDRLANGCFVGVFLAVVTLSGLDLWLEY